MLKLTGWTTLQASRLNHIRRNRLKRGLDPMAPLALDGFNVPTAAGREFLTFAHEVGGRYAETMRHRVWEYVALHAAQTGEILVHRSEFGRVVLSRSYDPIGRTLGERVYDALVSSGLASAVGDVTKPRLVTSPRTPGDVTSARPVTSQTTPGDVTDADPVTSPPVSGDVTGRDPVTSPDGPREPARVALRAHAQPTRSAGAASARARTGEAVSSLNGATGDVTGDDTGAAPDQTGNQNHHEDPTSHPASDGARTAGGRRDGAAAVRPVVGQTFSPAAWLEAQVEPTRKSLAFLGHELDEARVRQLLSTLDDVRRSTSPLAGEANALLSASARRRDPAWLRCTERVIERVRTGSDGPDDHERRGIECRQLLGLLRGVHARKLGSVSEQAWYLVQHGQRELDIRDWIVRARDTLALAAQVSPADQAVGSAV